MAKANGSDRFFSGEVTTMKLTGLPGGVPVEDRTFAGCPGESFNPDCFAKVVIHPGNKINYCCVPCWETTWAITREVFEDVPAKPHSTECVWRQERRKGEPVVEGTFTVASPSEVPGSRL